MRYRTVLLAALTGLGVASCGETPPPPAAKPGPTGSLTAAPTPARRLLPAPPGGPIAAPPAAPGAPAGPHANLTAGLGTGSTGLAALRPAAPSAPVSDAPIPPADAQFTIFCYAMEGVEHVEQAAQLKQSLLARTGRRDWYVIHGKDASNVYFGFYRVVGDPKTPADAEEANRARVDRQMIADLEWPIDVGNGTTSNEKLFKTAGFISLDAPDPLMKPEWDLASVDRNKDKHDDARAFWSLQVMAFRDNPKRKEAAVQAVEALRKQNIPAYYYHGDSISSVCVGAWRADAVEAQATDGGAGSKPTGPQALRDPTGKGRQNYDIVVTSEAIPDDFIPKKSRDGKPVVAMAPRLVVQDKTLGDMIKRFPDHAVNYEVRVRTGKNGAEIRDQSFLVIIPRPKGNGRFDPDDVLTPPPSSVPPPVESGRRPVIAMPGTVGPTGTSRAGGTAVDAATGAPVARRTTIAGPVGPVARPAEDDGSADSTDSTDFGPPTPAPPARTVTPPPAGQSQPPTPGAGRLRRVTDR